MDLIYSAAGVRFPVGRKEDGIQLKEYTGCKSNEWGVSRLMGTGFIACKVLWGMDTDRCSVL